MDEEKKTEAEGGVVSPPGVEPIPSVEKPAAPAKAEKPKIGPARRVWRAILIGLVAVAAVFLAGVLASYFLRYRPLAVALHQSQAQLAQANQEMAALQAELDSAKNKLDALQAEVAELEKDRQELQSQLDDANAHLELLQVLVDVSSARLALFLEDAPGAQKALVDTPQRLEDLAARLEKADPNLAQSLPNRLKLIRSSLESNDLVSAKVDLELMTRNLLDIEAALFSK